MIKVALLKSRFSYRGGLEKYTLRLARAFANAGCHVTLLTTETSDKPSSTIDFDVVPIANTSKLTLYHLLHFDAACKKWIQDYPQDIVFGLERTTCQTHYRAGSGVHAVFLKRRALTDSRLKKLSCLINPLHLALLHLERKAFESEKLCHLFTNSEMVKKEILDHYSTPAEKITVVHNGVEWKEWEDPFEDSFSKERPHPFHFLFIGNGYRRKGLSFLLQGAALLPTRDFHISVIGKEKDMAFFQREVKQLSLGKQVTFYGPQTNILPFYQAADALVIPSIYDPFANVTVEALAMGLYVVTSTYNGGKEILTPLSGTVIENLTSAESVADSLKKSLSFPKTFASAKNIRNSIERLDFSHQLNKIVEKTLLLS